jgi:hypothetical protein
MLPAVAMQAMRGAPAYSNSVASLAVRRTAVSPISIVEVCCATIFITLAWSNAMDREPIKTDSDDFSDDFSGDLAKVWRTAQQRRAEDIGAWLGQLFGRRRLKVADDGANYPKGRPALGSAKA